MKCAPIKKIKVGIVIMHCRCCHLPIPITLATRTYNVGATPYRMQLSKRREKSDNYVQYHQTRGERSVHMKLVRTIIYVGTQIVGLVKKSMSEN